ncbi:MAG: hypothetical protein KatS3mg087_0949 [Patescibacteria group bacterium]|nr:MAG: hypothetical protein KatS3mg087_0949 [Patescibacteria group bacterium]
MFSLILTIALSAAAAFAHRWTSVRFLIRWILNFLVGWLGVIVTNMFLGAQTLQLSLFSMIGASIILLIANAIIWIRFAPRPAQTTGGTPPTNP